MSDPNTIEIETLRELISGFFDYFVPKGGVSVVPRGPFSRAIEHMGGCENCGGDPFQHKDWCEEPTPYDDIVEDGGLPEAREAAAAWTPDPKPVESAEYVAKAIANTAYNLGFAPALELVEASAMSHIKVIIAKTSETVRAERDAYWREKVGELERQKNGAYTERNRLVALASKLFPSWLERHPESDVEWEDDWRWIVFVRLPTGQASWHIHDSELETFDHLGRQSGNSWDGHSDEEKYRRVDAIMAEVLGDE